MIAPGEGNLEVRGLAQLTTALDRLADRLHDEVAVALYREGELIMTEAKTRTPVLTGTLKSSGKVDQPVGFGRNVSVKLSFGGAARGYAIFVHENVRAFHHVGRSKFLESAVREAIPHLARRIAARISGRTVGAAFRGGRATG